MMTFFSICELINSCKFQLIVKKTFYILINILFRFLSSIIYYNISNVKVHILSAILFRLPEHFLVLRDSFNFRIILNPEQLHLEINVPVQESIIGAVFALNSKCHRNSNVTDAHNARARAHALI